ncbi:MAG: hypothetical protein JW874_00350 [Spirochaetales bacterium]|nr:hypothetical protein [Spirochaetales bacterium]
MAFPLIRLVSLIICGILIIYQLALYKRNGSRGKLVFLFWLCALFYRTFTELGYNLSSSFQQAVVWWHLDVAGPVLQALWLHYILGFVSGLEKREVAAYEKKIIIAVWFLSGVFFLLDLFTNWISREPVSALVGFRHRANAGSLAAIFYFIWLFLIGAYVLYLLVLVCVRQGKQHRARLVRMTMLIVLVILSLVFDLLLPLLQIPGLETVNVALVGIALLLSMRQSAAEKAADVQEQPEA